MNKKLQTILHNRLLISRILWVALFSSAAIISYIPRILVRNGAVSSEFSLEHFLREPVNIGLGVVGIGMAILSMILPRLIKIKVPKIVNSNEFIESRINLRNRKGQRVWSNEDILLLKSLSLEELQTIEVAEKKMNFFVAELAIAEAATMVGLVASQVSQMRDVTWPFFAVTAVIFVIKWPRLKSFTDSIFV